MVLGLIGVIVGVLATARLRRLQRDQRVLLADGSSADLIEGQARLARAIEAITKRLDILDDRIGIVEHRAAESLRTTPRRFGLVRYNAFGDEGGHQSWSLALLDSDRSGIVMTGLLGREETRMYVKRLTTGAVDSELSDEEAEAVRRAMADGASDDADPGGAPRG